MMQVPGVKERISEIIEDRKRQFEITGELVIHELALVAFASIGDLLDEAGDISREKLAKASPALKRAISQIENDWGGRGPESGPKLKIKMHDKLKALQLLGQNKRLFVERVEHAGEDGGPIVMEMNFVQPTKKD